MMATPTVPAEPQDVPVTVEMIAAMIKAVRTRYCGLIRSTP